jgi:hypothetical protein
MSANKQTIYTFSVTNPITGIPTNVDIIVIKLVDAIELLKTHFKGQKISHPIIMKQIIEEYSFVKRRRTITKTKSSLCYDNSFISPDVGEKIRTSITMVKHDGRCCFAKYNKETKKFSCYARIDNYRDKVTKKFRTPGVNWIPCEPMPGDETVTHWPHFRPVEEDPNDYKWIIEAFDNFQRSGALEHITESFTFELMGRKCNPNVSDPISSNAVVIPHGCMLLSIPDELKTVDGIKQILIDMPFMEGIVFVCNDNTVFKVRRDMYYDDTDQRLKWPSDTCDQFEKIFSHVNIFSFDKGLSSLITLENII